MTIRTLNKAYVAITLAITTGIATPGIQAVQTDTPLRVAVRENKVDAVRALLETAAGKAQLNQVHFDHGTPLAEAAGFDHLEVAEILIQYGAKVNFESGITTPLHHAAGPNVTRLLIAHGANVDAIDDYGMTPLHDIMRREVSPKTTGKATILIKNGADVNKRSGPDAVNPGHSPLDLAAKSGNVAGAKLLIEYGADIYAKAALLPNWTALDCALELPCDSPSLPEKQALVAKMLVQCGADLEAETSQERTPLSFVISDSLYDELCELHDKRLQAVKLWAENLQKQHNLPTDIANLLSTFALTKNQYELFMDEEFMKTNPEAFDRESGPEKD